jgi:hypothetical protein
MYVKYQHVMYQPTAGQRRDKHNPEISSQQQKDIHS